MTDPLTVLIEKLDRQLDGVIRSVGSDGDLIPIREMRELIAQLHYGVKALSTSPAGEKAHEARAPQRDEDWNGVKEPREPHAALIAEIGKALYAPSPDPFESLAERANLLHRCVEALKGQQA